MSYRSDIDLLLLASNEAARRASTAALSDLGFIVYPCRDLPGLLAILATVCRPLVVLAMDTADAHLVTARLRISDANSGIVVFSSFAHSQSRAQTLLCGADVCLDVEMPARELVANFHSLIRRLFPVRASRKDTERDAHRLGDAHAQADDCKSLQPPVPAQAPAPAWRPDMQVAAAAPAAPSGWQLADRGWVLISPEGRALALTTAERSFIMELFGAPDRSIRRDVLLDAGLAGTGRGDVAVAGRYLNAMVSRLRKKADTQGISLPVRAVHGWGYTFMGEMAGAVKAEEVHAWRQAVEA